MGKNMILKASTNKVGSTSELDLCITEEEWEAMDDGQQNEIISECIWELVDAWAEAV